MNKSRKKLGLIVLIIVIAIFGIIISNRIKKNNACTELLEARQNVCNAYEELIPEIVQSQCMGIGEVRVSAIPETNRYKYKDLDNKQRSYYTWDDNIVVYCTGTDQFAKARDKEKLQIISELLSTSYDSIKEIRAKTSPLYDGYCNDSSGIMNLFDETAYCDTNLSVYVTSGTDTYRYRCYTWDFSLDGFFKNDKWVDLSGRYTSTTSKSNKSTDRKQTGSSSNKKSGSSGSGSRKSSNRDKQYDMPDCDDYEDFEDFMDNWDGCMPDGSDAEDYWDNW